MAEPYQKQLGDFEIRILPDGRVVLIAPDEAMMEVFRSMDHNMLTQKSEQENTINVPTQKS